MSLTKVSYSMITGAVFNVLDYGADPTGTNDSTTAYTTLVATAPSGSTIRWPAGTYKGKFYAKDKAFNLVCDQGVTLKSNNLSNTDPIIWMEGSIGTAQALSVAPSYGNGSLTFTGTSNLVANDLALLYSGTVRPSDSQAVNYEIIKMGTTTALQGFIYSTQNGGTPTSSKITPIQNFTISGFNFDLGSDAGTAAQGYAIWVRYAENVTVENITAVGGYGTTIRLESVYNGIVNNATRSKPYSTSSGYGYHVQLLNSKYINVSNVIAATCRHALDYDSSYLINSEAITSTNCPSEDIVMTHNGYGGYHTYNNVNITMKNLAYAMVASADGLVAADYANQIARNFTITNTNIERQYTQTGQSASIYFQYCSKDIVIDTVNVTNTIGQGYTNQMAIRFAGPIGGKSRISNCYIQAHAWGIFFSNDIVSTVTAFPRNDEQVVIENLTCRQVNTVVYDNTTATNWLYIKLDSPVIYDDSSYYAAFDCFLRVNYAHYGKHEFIMRQSYGDRASNKIVVNPNNFAINFDNRVTAQLDVTLTPASSTLTQTDLMTSGSPVGRFLAAGTVTSVDKPCGYNQAVTFLCNGSVSINDATNVVSGPITANANEVINLISTGTQWRKINTPGSW